MKKTESGSGINDVQGQELHQTIWIIQKNESLWKV